MKTIHTDVACTVCGCVCDDLTVTVEGNRVTAVERACRLAEPWFLAPEAPPEVLCAADGTSVPFDFAVQRAAAILTEAKAPLIYGLSRSTTEGQRAATALADRLGAGIDTTAGTGHGPSIVALQEVGESTCTLGEVKNRADLVIFWACDPATTHPRHLERYSADPVGRFVPEGRKGRHLVVVDRERKATAGFADEFIPVPEDQNWDALWRLRLLVNGHDCEAPQALRDLAERMKRAKFGIVFFGRSLTVGPMGHRTVAALLQLTTDLNDFTRFYARRLRRYGDVAGADSVLTWQTGYPFGVNFARGYPRSNPGEFTGVDLLSRGEVDACVVVGAETVSDFPTAAMDHLRRIPTIVLDPFALPPDWSASVRFTTAIYGIHRPGTAYRMDEVPIPLRMLTTSEAPSDAEVLNAILSAVG